MDRNLKEIIDALVASIVKSKVDIKNLEKKLNHDIKSNEAKNLLRFTHYKYHKNILVSTKNCQEKHCLECLTSLFFCDHQVMIKSDEKALFSYSAQNLEKITKPVNIKRNCPCCNASIRASNFIKSSCFCECLPCVLSNYKQFIYTCTICGRSYENKEILQISSSLNQSVYIYCHSCFQALNHSSLQGNTCEPCTKKLQIDPYSFY